MPIRQPAVPAQVIDAATVAATRLRPSAGTRTVVLSGAAFSFRPVERLVAPLPVAMLSPEGLAGPDPRAGADPVRWRCLAVDADDRPLGFIEVPAGPPAAGPPAPGAPLTTGPEVDATVAALRQAQEMTASDDVPYEATILWVPRLNFTGLWLRTSDTTKERIIPTVTHTPRLPAGRAIPADRVLAVLREETAPLLDPSTGSDDPEHPRGA